MAQYRPKSIDELLRGRSSGTGSSILAALQSYKQIRDSDARTAYYAAIADEKSEKYVISAFDDILKNVSRADNINNASYARQELAGLERFGNVTATPHSLRKFENVRKELNETIKRGERIEELQEYEHDQSVRGELDFRYYVGFDQKTGKSNMDKIHEVKDKISARKVQARKEGWLDPATETLIREMEVTLGVIENFGAQTGHIEEEQVPKLTAEWNKYTTGRDTGTKPYIPDLRNLAISSTTQAEQAANAISNLSAKVDNFKVKIKIAEADLKEWEGDTDSRERIPKDKYQSMLISKKAEITALEHGRNKAIDAMTDWSTREEHLNRLSDPAQATEHGVEFFAKKDWLGELSEQELEIYSQHMEEKTLAIQANIKQEREAAAALLQETPVEPQKEKKEKKQKMSVPLTWASNKNQQPTTPKEPPPAPLTEKQKVALDLAAREAEKERLAEQARQDEEARRNKEVEDKTRGYELVEGTEIPSLEQKQTGTVTKTTKGETRNEPIIKWVYKGTDNIATDTHVKEYQGHLKSVKKAEARKNAPTIEYEGKTYSQTDFTGKGRKSGQMNKVKNNIKTIDRFKKEIEAGNKVEHYTKRISELRADIESILGTPI